MAFSIIVGLAFALGVGVLLLALLGRRRGSPAPRWAGDVAVYRDQLSEIDADLERGLVRPSEAEEARAEIGRRLLRASHARNEGPSTGTKRRRLIAVGFSAAALTASLGLYLVVGNPGDPDLPLAGRERVASAQSIASLIDSAETYLKHNPNDGRGWATIAPIYLRLGRFAAAAHAYREANRLNGPAYADLLGLGEALTFENGGSIPPEATKAFEKAVKLNGRDINSKLYLAVAKRQAGDTAGAVALWRQIASDSKDRRSWLPLAQNELQLMGVDAAAIGLSSQEIAAAGGSSGMSNPPPMVVAMVARLQARLSKQGGTPEDWIKLARSYLVLGKREQAQAAIRDALESLGPNSEGAATVEAAAAQMGIAAGGQPAPASAQNATDSPKVAVGSPGAVSSAAPATAITNPPPMVVAMVHRLQARLSAQGGSPEEWIRLARSYVVLGKPSQAKTTISDAIRSLGTDAQGVAEVKTAATQLGLD